MLLLQFEEAERCYNRQLELTGGDIYGFYNRSYFYYETEQLDRAIADADSGIALDPEFGPMWSNRGLALQHKYGIKHPEALESLTKAVELISQHIAKNPREVWAYCHRGRAYRSLGKLEDAIADQSSSIALDPEYTQAWSDRGLAHYQRGDWSAAQADFKHAISLRPTGTHRRRAAQLGSFSTTT